MEQYTELRNVFFNDIQSLSQSIKINDVSEIKHVLRLIRTANKNAVLLQLPEFEKITYALKSIFISLDDEKIFLNKNIQYFLNNASEKLLEILKCILENEKYNEKEFNDFILLCDRIAYGEIVELNSSEIKDSSEDKYKDINTDVKITRSDMNSLLKDLDDIYSIQQQLKNQINTIFEYKDFNENIETKKISQQINYNINLVENLLDETKNKLSTLSMYPLLFVLNNVYDYCKQQQELKLLRDFTLNIFKTNIVLDKELLSKVENILCLCINEKIISDKKISEINIESSFDGENIKIIIQDNGYGLDDKIIRNKLIEVFPKKENQIKTMEKNDLFTMMFNEDYSKGLNHLWKLVEEIKGHIKLYSEINKGSIIILTFPNTLSKIHGFFITVKKQTFFITNHYIFDTVNNSKETLHTIQNQYYLNYHGQDISVYSLHSLINLKDNSNNSSSGIILITEYLDQKIGIIVDTISKCVSLQKKDLPSSFEKFTILQGLVYNEKHDLIPVLFIPEILKKLISYRNYDYKKNEVFSKKTVYKILLADDSETARQIEKSALKADDFYIDEAEDGIFAIEKLKQNKYDLIITDTLMPRMNGKLLIENLKRMENYKGTPVIVIQPSTDDEEKVMYQNLGVNAFVLKNDFKRQEFIKLVKELIYG